MVVCSLVQCVEMVYYCGIAGFILAIHYFTDCLRKFTGAVPSVSPCVRIQGVAVGFYSV